MDNHDQYVTPVQQSESSTPPTSVQEMPSQSPLAPKSKRGLKVALIAVGFALFLGIGFFIGWWVYGKGQVKSTDGTTNQSTSQTTAEADALTPDEVIANIQEKFSVKYTLLNLDENNHPNAGQMSIRWSKVPPPYKTEGYTFYTDYDGGAQIDFMTGPTDLKAAIPRAIDVTLRTEVADYYKSIGLTKSEEFGDASVSSDVTEVYTGKGIVCTIQEPHAGTSSNSASCGLVVAYKPAAEKYKPIADVLKSVTASTVLSGLKITDSTVKGYQRAELSQGNVTGGGSIALVYKKDSGSWVYFRNSQEIIECSQYSTTDLRNAFKGDPCYDSSLSASTFVK